MGCRDFDIRGRRSDQRTKINAVRSWWHESALTYALATCSISENNTLQYKYIQSILAGIFGIDVHQDVLIH